MNPHFEKIMYITFGIIVFVFVFLYIDSKNKKIEHFASVNLKITNTSDKTVSISLPPNKILNLSTLGKNKEFDNSLKYVELPANYGLIIYQHSNGKGWHRGIELDTKPRKIQIDSDFRRASSLVLVNTVCLTTEYSIRPGEFQTHETTSKMTRVRLSNSDFKNQRDIDLEVNKVYNLSELDKISNNIKSDNKFYKKYVDDLKYIYISKGYGVDFYGRENATGWYRSTDVVDQDVRIEVKCFPYKSIRIINKKCFTVVDKNNSEPIVEQAPIQVPTQVPTQAPRSKSVYIKMKNDDDKTETFEIIPGKSFNFPFAPIKFNDKTKMITLPANYAMVLYQHYDGNGWGSGIKSDTRDRIIILSKECNGASSLKLFENDQQLPTSLNFRPDCYNISYDTSLIESKTTPTQTPATIIKKVYVNPKINTKNASSAENQLLTTLSNSSTYLNNARENLKKSLNNTQTTLNNQSDDYRRIVESTQKNIEELESTQKVLEESNQNLEIKNVGIPDSVVIVKEKFSNKKEGFFNPQPIQTDFFK